jgi:hypothetical protein
MQQDQVILLNRHHHKEVDQRAIHVDHAKNHSFKGKYGQLYVFYDRVKDDFFVTTSSDPTDLAARIDISADVKVVTEKPVLITQPVLGVQQTSVLVADNKVGALSTEQLQSISNPVTASAPARVIEASRVTDTASQSVLGHAASSTTHLNTEKKKEDVKKGGFLSNLFGRK